MFTSPGIPLRVPSLTNAITDETIGVPADCHGRYAVSVEITSTDTTSSGVVTIETAGTKEFGGTWSSITTVNASDTSGGNVKFIFLPLAAYAWIRTRVSTAIGGGGSVTTIIRGA